MAGDMCTELRDHISHHVEQHFSSTSEHGTQQELAEPPQRTPAGTSTAVHASPCWDEGESMKICTYANCQDLVFASEWDDHMFAHMLEDQDDAELMSLATGQSLSVSNGILSQQMQQQSCLNDNLLAQLSQQELDSALETDLQLHEDWLSAHDIEKEQQRLREEEEFKKLQTIYGMLPNQGGYTKQYDQKMKQDVGKMKMSVGEYYARKADMYETLMTGHDSKESHTQGLISCLQASYSNGVSGIRTVQLCLETDHFASGVGDAGWGCGYRNTQMILSALLRSSIYRDVVSKGIDGGEIPSIPKIQSMIENAWQLGFDKQGAEQLGNKLHNTSKWIGATEIAALLRSLRIRAKLVDFHEATGSDGTHPRMFTWIHQYYNRISNSHEPSPPLFLQHQGHSRLCIGVEEHPRGECPVYLLLFDPSHAPRQMKALLQNVSSNVSAQLRLLRRSLKQMRSKQYQILYIDGLYEDDLEIEQSKQLESLRVP
eukprot:gene17399-8999_t